MARRPKELDCLHQVAHAIRTEGDLLALFREVAKRIPPGWQCPELTCCRVDWDGQSCVSPGFRETAWRQAADLVVGGKRRGAIEVFYLEERPPADEGPFLEAERNLIEVLALLLSEAAERQEARAVARAWQDRLARAEAFSHSLIHTANVMIIGLDLHGNIQVFNAAAERITGYVPAELMGRNWFELLVPKERYPQVWAEFARLLAGGLPQAFENPILTKSGEERWIAWRTSELREEGRIVGTISFGVDLTEHIHLAEALQRSEEFTRRIIECSRDCIKVLDAAGRLEYMSRAGQELLEIQDLQPCLGVSYEDFWDEADREGVRAAIATALAGEIGRFTGCVATRGGTPKWWDAVASPIRGRDGKVERVLVVSRDITERIQAERAIAEERARVDQILNQLLPPCIAQRLKTENWHVADTHDDVSVLFADLVAFSRWSAAIAPQAVVELLNRIFCEFDRLARCHGVQKIGTQGDSYLVVAGVPTARPDHAEAVAELALEMCQAVRQFTTPEGQPVSARLGIHAGPAVAAIIGEHAYQYDVWGQTVTLASRMESTGKPGCIQVNQQTYERLRDRFRFERRGVIHVKGFGRQTTYWLKGRKTTNGAPPLSGNGRSTVS